MAMFTIGKKNFLKSHWLNYDSMEDYKDILQ